MFAAVSVYGSIPEMKFAICNEVFQGWKIDAVLEHCARLGYDGLEIAPFTLARMAGDITTAQRREIRDSAARHGVALCGLHWLLAKTEGLCLNHPDPAVRARTAAYFCELVDCCADLGGKTLVLGSPQQRNVPPGLAAEAAWDYAAQTLAPAVRRAGERGAIICLEPLAPAETTATISRCPSKASAVTWPGRLDRSIGAAATGDCPRPVSICPWLGRDE